MTSMPAPAGSPPERLTGREPARELIDGRTRPVNSG
jgi:hypothetical protein